MDEEKQTEAPYIMEEIDGPEIIFPPGIDAPEPTPKNTSYYVRDLDGVLWFYCMNWRTRVREFFPEKGPTIGELIEDAVKFAARNAKSTTELN